MKTNVTRSRISGASIFAGALALAMAAPLTAADDNKDKDKQEAPAEPVTNRTVTAGDVAMTPISDLNLQKDEIPPLLLEAQNDPYSTAGLKKCAQYVTAIQGYDAVLGPDFDVADKEERKLTVGGVAQSVVGALIPFRGVIRELSGANKHEREFQDAIMAGVMRRAFLKGMGLKLGCKYPARPADAKVKAQYAAAREAAKQAEEAKKNEKKDKKDD